MFAMFRPWEAFKQQPDQIPAPLFLAFFHQKDAGIPLPTGDFFTRKSMSYYVGTTAPKKCNYTFGRCCPRLL